MMYNGELSGMVACHRKRKLGHLISPPLGETCMPYAYNHRLRPKKKNCLVPVTEN